MTKKKLLIIVASAIVFVGACIGVCIALFSKKVEKIDVLKKDMPQLVYVQGSDLNLSSGKVTAVIGDEKVEIALNDPEVSITGYDKNKLGEQTLTITYEEKTTTIKVTVVPRVVVEKYETGYFVGEEFDDEKGNLLITNDDGTQFNVSFDEETVSVEGFSTNAANDALTVTAVYENEGVSYSGSFTVSVYDIASVTLNQPNKKEYKNHETKLDLAGSYLTFKNDSGSLIRYVILTEDMVSGFDLSQATIENRGENYLNQTLTIEYLGVEKTYDIQITFSDLSLIRLRAEEFKDFEWTEGATPDGCDAEMGDNALEAMSVYFAMEEDEKTDVEAEDLEVLVKTAATYGLDKWKKAFKAYEDAFVLSDSGLAWNCKDYEKTKAVYNSLAEKNPVIYEDAVILKQIESAFADTVIVPAETEEDEAVTVGGILAAVYSTETMDDLAGQLELMLTLYESLVSIPENWTLESLKTSYSEVIESTWVLLRESEHTHIRYRPLYGMASRWRAQDDLFEILYAYYYDETNLDDKGDVDLTKINAFSNFHLPGDLETIYTYLYNAKTQVEYVLNGYIKSEEFLYYYEKAMQLRDKILASGSDMEKDLYNRLKFDYLIGNADGTGYEQYSFTKLFSLFRTTTMGYLHQFNAYLGVPEFEAIWAQTLAIMDEANRVGEAYFETSEFGAAVEAMFVDYMALSPTQQMMFMTMLNPYYGSMPSKAWDDSEVTYNSFVYFVYKHYRNVLPESTHDAFYQLMLAAENLSIVGVVSNQPAFYSQVEYFTQGMSAVASYLDSVDSADRQAFINELRWFYDDYVALATEKFYDVENVVTEDLGEWKDDFDDLYTAFVEAYFAMNISMGGNPLTLNVLATYEKIDQIASKILASNNESVIKAYYYDVMQKDMVLPGSSQAQTLAGTADFLVFYVRNTYTTMLRSSAFTQGYLLYDYYNDINVENSDGTDLKDFLAKASYLYNTCVRAELGMEKEGDKYYDYALVQEILTDFRKLSTQQQHYLFVLDNAGSNVAYTYRLAVHKFALEQGLDRNAVTVVDQLLLTQLYYTFYQMYPDGTDETEESPYLTLLSDGVQTLVEDYYLLGQEDKASQEAFDFIFGDMYEYYLDAFEKAGIDVTYTPPTTEEVA